MTSACPCYTIQEPDIHFSRQQRHWNTVTDSDKCRFNAE